MKTNPLDPTLRNLNCCGCCAGLEAQTPAAISNRPGLPAIAFRAGTHGRFKASLLAALSDDDRLQLGTLRTREDDDFAIALLDGFAAMADVLTFYSERIANESYLRTATEHCSVLELARAIGYELRPGVAAGAWLAFTVEDAPGAPGHADIAKGTKVQSIPGPGEKPQTYETVEDLVARKEWNKLKPRSTRPPTMDFGLTRLYLKGTGTQLQPGDAILIVGDERDGHPGNESWDFRLLQTVIPEPAADRTLVTWEKGLGWRKPPHEPVHPAKENVVVFAFRQRAALFGHNAPDWRALPTTTRQAFCTVSPVHGLLGEYFDTIGLTGRKFSRIDGRVEFHWKDNPPAPSVPADYFSVRWSGWLKPPATATYTFYTLSDDGVRLWVNGRLILENWTDHGPSRDSGTIDLEGGRYYDIRLEYYERTGGADIELRWSSPTLPERVIPTTCLFVTPDEWPNFNIAYSASVAPAHNVVSLDAPYPKVRVDSWLVLDRPGYTELYKVTNVATSEHTDFTLTSRSSMLTLDDSEHLTDFGLRTTVVYCQSEPLALAEAPVAEPVGGHQIVLDGVIGDLEAGRKLLLCGRRRERVRLASGKVAVDFLPDTGPQRRPLRAGENLEVIEPPTTQPDGTGQWYLRAQDGQAGLVTTKPGNLVCVQSGGSDIALCEQAVLQQAVTSPDNAQTTLILQAPLKNTYDPVTLSISANVAPATHGETVEETVGGGDASQPHQHFVLKQANQDTPLTFVSANTPTGSESSLEVFVDDVKWTEVESLYWRGPKERVFVARRQGDGTTRLTFGDGWSGALLPTGRENIRARYRRGLGMAGNVKAGQLALLMSRPLGVKAVTNPMASSGAQDPESLDDARRNAPLQTLTLGRVVSLQDYEDFARAFSGVAKAHATWVWTPRGRGVFVTIMPPGGATPSPTDTTLSNLVAALRDFGNRLVPVRAEFGKVIPFKLAGEIRVNPDRIAERVQASVEATLRKRFQFDARELGQSVALSEVIALAQDVPGVASVELTQFRFVKRAAAKDPRNTILFAWTPRPGGAMDSAQPAEVLVLTEQNLSAVKVNPT